MKKITSYNEVATELVTEYTMEEKRNLQLTENELVSRIERGRINGDFALQAYEQKTFDDAFTTRSTFS